MDDFIQQQVKAIRAQVGADKVLLGLSGGVDSSVCAALLEKAIPDQVVCIFVDHGCMRKNEGDEVEAVFAKKRLKFVRVNAESRFLAKLAGVTDPEAKRKIIGKEFVEVFNEEARKYGDCKYLAQGTIYPDVIESGANNTVSCTANTEGDAVAGSIWNGNNTITKTLRITADAPAQADFRFSASGLFFIFSLTAVKSPASSFTA